MGTAKGMMTRIETETFNRRVIVDMADMKVTNDSSGSYSTYVLGSCVAVAIYDPVAKVGGLLHFILPESAINTQKALQNPYIFADTGIPLLFRNAYKLGAEKERIICRLAGGSDVLDPNNTFNVGMRNHAMAVQILNKNNVKIAGDYPGGRAGVTLTLHMSTGRAVVKLPNGEEIEI
jgi:chemotaxis protein CheD